MRSNTALSNVAGLAVRELPDAACRGGFTISLGVDQRAGWILEPVDSDSLMRPDRKVAAKRIAIQSYALFMRILDDQVASEAEPKSLSRREKECLTLLAQGMRTQRIAEQIAISPVTVEFHFKNAPRKLGALTREQALAISVQNGWVQV
ncbi:LuxR C-terminal-related transcriptional regulator [Ahrensia marina]|uniref:helix-turn-helix transcriptional regulator n=1 Tax=Ahrensia marina TaxID=1514904 RepID=UPI0035CF0AE5